MPIMIIFKINGTLLILEAALSNRIAILERKEAYSDSTVNWSLY